METGTYEVAGRPEGADRKRRQREKRLAKRNRGREPAEDRDCRAGARWCAVGSGRGVEWNQVRSTAGVRRTKAEAAGRNRASADAARRRLRRPFNAPPPPPPAPGRPLRRTAIMDERHCFACASGLPASACRCTTPRSSARGRASLFPPLRCFGLPARRMRKELHSFELAPSD
ncbi:hypothetical protein R5R35_014084 [Gryllus longicercus]|uniref:Uncharacterized protein n=1 Tax=Gryllus longicercus TaxID=2509291 RepID=A0AAN9ZEA7_9ORTH